jgi:hypothetical protein
MLTTTLLDWTSTPDAVPTTPPRRSSDALIASRRARLRGTIRACVPLARAWAAAVLASLAAVAWALASARSRWTAWALVMPKDRAMALKVAVDQPAGAAWPACRAARAAGAARTAATATTCQDK